MDTPGQRHASRYVELILRLLITFFLFYLLINTFYFLVLLFIHALGGLNMTHEPAEYAYGNYSGILFSLLLFSFFTLGYLRPVRPSEWKRAGLYEAFIIALFAEMYGFPLTIYTISWLFGKNLSFGHVEGHLSALLLSGTGIVSLTGAWLLVMFISSFMLLIGFYLVKEGWTEVYGSDHLVTNGIYAHMRHPQYLGFFIIITGFMVQWPTIITLVMWPILLFTYYRLSQKEENNLENKFGSGYTQYKERVPMFVPALTPRFQNEM